MLEITANLHLHTTASDGTGSHDAVAAAAARAGLDLIIYTDHNIWIDGIEGWYYDSATGREVLRLMGQEINDQALKPERNHLLCHLISSDLNGVAADPQALIDTVLERGGLCFLAHPLERPGYEPAALYPWERWDVSGYTGIELWNAMTDAKWRMRTMLRGLLGAYWPGWVFSAPFAETLAKWDELLATGQKVVAIGGSDAHAMSFTLGPLTRTIYPYEYIFQTVNTHLLLAEPLARDLGQARQQVYEALKAGHCFVSYDLPASPRGFRFSATSDTQQAIMGDSLAWQGTTTLEVVSPIRAHLRLLKDGQLVAETRARQLSWQASEPGIYRVEAYQRFWGQWRGWVFTNPIYLIGSD